MVTWTAPHPDPVDGPMTGPDGPLLRGYLDWQRSTFLNICAGLSGEQLARRPLAVSSLSLLGLLRHLAKVERVWFRIGIAAEPVDWLFPRGSDTDFEDTDPARAEAEYAVYLDETARARAIGAAADLDHEFDWDGQPMSVRMVLVHTSGEYARHNGHADLLRELTDGVTGR